MTRQKNPQLRDTHALFCSPNAVALGRFLQNPLAMIAALYRLEREILSWNLGLLEHFLTPEEKNEMVEQVMVDVTNQVMVDVDKNEIWLQAMTSFFALCNLYLGLDLGKLVLYRGH
jgi:transcriptional accessory protein Tex/SPT6